MSEDINVIIERRYEKTSDVRDKVIELLAGSDTTLSQTLADKDSATILIKMLDG